MQKTDLSGKTVFISGATRGIGKAIGLKLAEAGCNIIVTGKTVEPHEKLKGTIYTSAKEMIKAGGQAIAVKMDVRNDDEVQEAVDQAVERFGGIDIVINNASAIHLADTQNVPMKRYDLMMDVNVRGSFLTVKTCLPYLKKSDHAHILTMSPPHPMDDKWFGQYLAYAISKYNMSLCTLGWAQEFEGKIGVNSLWPVTTIATAAIKHVVGGDEMIKRSRQPAIVADAAYAILQRNPADCNGNFFTDEVVLKEEGVTDFSGYAVDEEAELMGDLFL